MVKNTKGGCGHKGLARKHNKEATEQKTYLATDPAEIYAVVTKLFGGGLCLVECHDGVRRQCHIRGKFSGRRKRDNIVTVFSWVLVGLRDYETAPVQNASFSSSSSSSAKPQKLPNCDLLLVYSDQDKRVIREYSEDIYRSLVEKMGAAGGAGGGGGKGTTEADYDCGVDFIDDDGDETYAKLMKKAASSSTSSSSSTVAPQTIPGEEDGPSMDFNIDDI